MLDDGLFARFPRPNFAVALHVSPIHATGKVAYRAGYAMANVDSVDITIHGRGGHGAYPHTTIDPIVIAARLILDLQTIVSREVKPIEPAVVTVGSIRGGTKHNIIAAECHLQLTVRSYAPEVRKQIHDEAIRRKAEAAAQSAGAPMPDVQISEGTPSLFNDEDLVARLVPVFKQVLGEENVVEGEPVMGGEDFSQYGLAGVPIMMYSLGSINEARLNEMIAQSGPPSLHSPVYYPDPEPTLTTGIKTLASAALELLEKP
jgi:hippurate hydrolase